MPAALRLDAEAVKALIGQLNDQEQIDIYRSLRKSVLKSRYIKLAEKTGSMPISFDDITEAVESVRTKQCPPA
jgi:hypothetical protein